MSSLFRAPAVPTVFLALLVLCATPILSPAQAQTTGTGGADTAAVLDVNGGAATCMKCHDKAPATTILHTVHGLKADSRTPFAKQECQSCHGRSEAHLKKPPEGQPRAEPDIVFGRNSPTPARRQNAVCLGCHQGGLRMNWPMSQHDQAEVPCAACHNPHEIKDKVLARATQPKICFQCHGEQRAQSMKRSHHPIREGKVVCSDCHNPHGSFGPHLLAKNTVNETCYQCHQDKRGPFLWEHAPVTDDCTNCHIPHGSNQPRLLKIRTPFLCQTCHSEAYHPSTLYDGSNLPSSGPLSGGGPARLLMKGCLNCHSQVHGSNHPSGALLTR